MKKTALWMFAAAMLFSSPSSADEPSPYDQRSQDWRNGTVVYQIMVDRFAPSENLDAKRALYVPPRKLRAWSEPPTKGPYIESSQVWAHEVDYWGGDLKSVESKLYYLQSLGVKVLYFNPIFESLTNHKYDASDYQKVDPVYGDRAQLKGLCDDLHQRGMRLMLDGVFNHMGRRSPRFQKALKSKPGSPERDFFVWNKDGSAVGWADVDNLPELNLENPKVRDYIYNRPDSVVQSYLRNEGIDGWRLDVAFDLGYHYLAELTQKAHEAKPGSAVIGEIWNYPADWYPAVDGVMNMHGRAILLALLQGRVAPEAASRMWQTMVDDSGYEHMLKAWLVLDNHDTPRLNHILQADWQQKMARVLQFTLPGTVCLYYGSELGMQGGDDPENRAPMRWDLVNEQNPMLAFHKKLLAMRQKQPALRLGDFRRLESAHTFAFMRKTDHVAQTVLVIANPGEQSVKEFLQVPDSSLQDLTTVNDLLGSPVSGKILAGTLQIEIPAHQVVVLSPDTSPLPKGYSRYDRMK